MRPQLVTLCAGAVRALAVHQQRAEPVVAFTHVGVVASGRVRREQTVIVSGRRIIAVGAARATRIPADACILDATARCLTR